MYLLEPGYVALDVVALPRRLDHVGGKSSLAEGATRADLLEAAGITGTPRTTASTATSPSGSALLAAQAPDEDEDVQRSRPAHIARRGRGGRKHQRLRLEAFFVECALQPRAAREDVVGAGEGGAQERVPRLDAVS